MRRLSVRNQVLAVEVVDRREIEFPNLGDLLTRDPETDFEHTTGDSNPRARMDADSAAQRKVEACRMHRDPNLTGRHERGWPLKNLQHLGTVGSREHNSLHDRNLGAAAAVSPPTPAIAARAAKPIATISSEGGRMPPRGEDRDDR